MTNDIIEFNLNYISNKSNFKIRRLELKNLDSKALSTNECISLHKFLMENNLIHENDYGDLLLTNFAEGIMRNGGWLKYVATQNAKAEFENKKQVSELENLETNTRINKFLLKTKWLPHFIALISLLFSIYTHFESKSEIKSLENKIEKLENKK